MEWSVQQDQNSKALKALADHIARLTAHGEPALDAVPGLSLFRAEQPSAPRCAMYDPCICLVAQGRKCFLLGEETYVYDANNYLIAALPMPGMTYVVEATPEEPYLSLALRLDQRQISQLILDSSRLPPRPQPSGRGVATAEVNLPLLSAFQRLIDLYDTPEDAPILAPLVLREIYYRLLTGAQGERLRQMVSVGSHTHQIAQAITWLKENFRKPVVIEDLAALVNMSSSTFYQHFRSMTAISPLQFHKQLRLQEARRLMLEERMDAASAAFQVGYESPPQFNREYSRLFGAPPMRDISNYRKTIGAVQELENLAG